MSDENAVIRVHPTGEEQGAGTDGFEPGLSLDTFGGKIQVKWAPEAAVSSLGQMAFFIEFLKTSGRFDAWVEDCPLQYKSPNAPDKRNVLGTILLSVLSGHWRYAHISAIRGDGVNPELLGMTKVASEDSVRRAMAALDEQASQAWLKKHLMASYQPLLEETWVMDIDTTVKPLFGHQQDAVVGYNPSKPGRPSHAYHTYLIGNLRLVLDVEVQAGNQTASSYAQPDLWKFIDGLPAASQPAFMRGDCGWGNERILTGAEQRQIPYLFKLKQSPNVKKLIAQLFGKEGWVNAGQQWQGLKAELQLDGWSKSRHVIVLRRPLPPETEQEQEKRKKKQSKRKQAEQLTLDLEQTLHQGVRYEYSVLVTSLNDEVLTITQHYRDRGDSENNFDELKNQWGWAGFTTQDSNRCQVMARITALIYNWWTIFMRLAIPEKHAEAVTSRPLALHGIATRTRHANQTTVEITNTHAKAPFIAAALTRVSLFLKRLRSSAEQFTQAGTWRLILSAAFQAFLHGKILGSTPRLAGSNS